jgi:hypothetical protein
MERAGEGDALWSSNAQAHDFSPYFEMRCVGEAVYRSFMEQAGEWESTLVTYLNTSK